MSGAPAALLWTATGAIAETKYGKATAMSGGAWIFVIFIVLLFLAFVYGFHTRRGSGINQHPHGSNREDSASGAVGRSRISSAEDETEGAPDTHGTK